MNRTVSRSRSTTCAAIAGPSAPAPTPMRARNDSDGAPSADARASASRVAPGSPASRSLTSWSSVSGTGSGSNGPTSTRVRAPTRARRTDSHPSARGCEAGSAGRRPCLRRRPQCRHERERVARRHREAVETGADKVLQRRRNRQRLEQVDTLVEDADELQPEQRVAARRSWMRSSVWRGNGLPKRSWRILCRAPTLSGPIRSRSTSTACSSSAASRRRATTSRTAPPSRRRSAKARALADDASSHWTSSIATTTGFRSLNRLEHIAYGHCECALVGGLVRGLVTQKRDLQRASPRRGQLADHAVEDAVEEISEPHVREPALGLGRTRREHDKVEPARRRNRCPPQRRFPDSRLALEHERHWPVGGTVEEAKDGAELRVAPDHLNCAHPPIVTAPPAEISTHSDRPAYSEEHPPSHPNRSRPRRRIRGARPRGRFPTLEALTCLAGAAPWKLPVIGGRLRRRRGSGDGRRGGSGGVRRLGRTGGDRGRVGRRHPASVLVDRRYCAAAPNMTLVRRVNADGFRACFEPCATTARPGRALRPVMGVA